MSKFVAVASSLTPPACWHRHWRGMEDVAVIVAVRSTTPKPRLPLRVATGLRRAVTHADSVRVRQGFGGCVRRSDRRMGDAGRRRGQRRSRRNLLLRLRRQEDGSDLHRLRHFQRCTLVSFDYVNEIFVAGDGKQGLQVNTTFGSQKALESTVAKLLPSIMARVSIHPSPCALIP
ncbi:hypothetical protein VNO80_19456 [Phaseolus coccineus]|uniref:Uncharacterized protein n=1 Tax=Phaseolus coccineus TaxID=3886 RepID=A0AAN9MFP4_PHACN